MKSLGRFMGIEFYAHPDVPNDTVVIENVAASEPDVDFACGGTDTEPHSDPCDAIMQMPYRGPDKALTLMRLLLDTAFFSSFPGGLKTSRPPDLLAITRSIARGS